MIGLAAMFARMAQERQQEDNDLTRFRMLPGAGERPRRPDMPFRPPGQDGPMAPGAPPLDQQTLAKLFEAMK